MPSELYHNTDNPIPILSSRVLKASSTYGGVSLSGNKRLHAHGPFKLVFRNASWFSQLRPLLYLEPVMKGLGKVDHYVDQFGKTYSVEQFKQIPIKNSSTVKSGKVLKGTLQFRNEQEWYTSSSIPFNLKDVAELIVTIGAPGYDRTKVESIIAQVQKRFPEIPIKTSTAMHAAHEGLQKPNKTTGELFKSVTIKDKTGEIRELEIYANPRKYEIREILKYTEYPKDVTPYVNFFIDFRHKTVYIWNGEYATHADAAPLIPLDMHREETVSGIAEILYPEYKLNALALYQGQRDFKVFEWEWLDQYFRRISEEYEMITKKKTQTSTLKY